MILRAVFSHPDHPYGVHVDFYKIPISELKSYKRWLRKKMKLLNPGFEVQFKYFYTEEDFDDL